MKRLADPARWLECLLLVALAVVLRLPGYWHSVVIDWDESMYILVARQILDGQLPYVSVFQEKPLGAPVIVALAMVVFGVNVLGVRILGTLAVAATALILRAVAIRAGLLRLAAWLAGGTFVLFTQWFGGLATNTEILFLPFTAGAVWVALAHLSAASGAAQVRAVALGGILFGVAIWCKYIAAFDACVWFAALLGYWWQRRQLAVMAALGLAVLFAVLTWLPTVLAAGFYAAAGYWEPFWYANIGFMATYAGIGRPAEEMQIMILYFFWTTRVLWLVGLIAWIGWRRAPLAVTTASLWLLAEAAAIIAPWKFWDHYFLLALPPLCLIFAAGTDMLIARIAVARLPPAIPALGAVAIATILLATGALDIHRPDAPTAVAALINADPEPGATVWTVNAHPIIYILTGTPLPTLYAFPPHLVTPYSVLIPTDPVAEVRRVLANRPRYIVIDPYQSQWTLPVLDTLITQALARDYRLVAEIPAIHEPYQLYRLTH